MIKKTKIIFGFIAIVAVLSGLVFVYGKDFKQINKIEVIPSAQAAGPSVPIVQFSAMNFGGRENVSPVNIKISLSNLSTSNVSVDYAVTGGTATGGGVDYALANGTATIPAGSISTNISMLIVNDAISEPAGETVIITLSNPVNARLGGRNIHTSTIYDNMTIGGSMNSYSMDKFTNIIDKHVLDTNTPIILVSEADFMGSDITNHKISYTLDGSNPTFDGSNPASIVNICSINNVNNNVCEFNIGLLSAGTMVIFEDVAWSDDINIEGPGDIFSVLSKNVYGFAWSENIGWISFNSANCDTDNDGFSDSASPPCPSVGTFMQGYGVNLNADKTLSGYAWSENIGWASFNWPDIKNTIGNECPGGNGAAVCQAKLTGIDFTGWARACSVFQSGCSGALKPDSERGGWDGWIKLRKDLADGGANYGVSLSSTDFTGYAWGSDAIGWICFNNLTPGCDLGAAGPAYKVYLLNAPPIANNLQLSIPNNNELCGLAPDYNFQWDYNDTGAQSMFELQIDNNSDFSSPTVIRTVVSPPAIGSPNSQAMPLTSSLDTSDTPGYDPTTGKLSYQSTTYYWRVKVWDDLGADSGWINGPVSFTTPAHIYPDAKITCSPDLGVSCPASHSLLETIQFNNGLTCYDNFNNSIACSSWNWVFGDGTPNSSIQNPTHQYIASGQYILTFTAGDGLYSCSNTYPINIGSTVSPKWKEVIPR